MLSVWREARGMRECVEGVKGGAECDIERVVGQGGMRTEGRERNVFVA